MRWLLVHPGPNFSVADVYNGWAEALRSLGQDVAEYNLDARLTFYDAALLETGTIDATGHPEVRKALDRNQAISMAAAGLFAACYQILPQVILATSAFFTPPWVLEVLRARGHKIVMLFTESPYQDTQQLRMAEYAHLNLLNDPVNIGAYEALGMPAAYMPHAYRPGFHCPGAPVPEMVCDLTFNGTGFASRIAFFEAMVPGWEAEGLDVMLSGNWDPLADGSPLMKYLAHEKDRCLDNEQTVQSYRSAKAGLNLYRREAEDEHKGEGWAVGPREVEMAAAGLWFARDPRGESDELFPMLPAFTSPAEASDLIRWALRHPGERGAAVVQARAAIADRTFENNVRRLLELLDRQPVRM